MMLKSKIQKLIALSLVFLFLGLISNVLVTHFDKKKRAYYLQVQSDLLATKYNTIYRYYKIMSQDIYDMYMNNPKLLSDLEKIHSTKKQNQDALREHIYKLLNKNYKRLTHMGISQVHFHLPDNTSYLRMYAPTQFGDDLSKTRFSVVAVNATHKKQEGFEACNFMTGLRFVYPISSKAGKYLGSMEVSFSSKEILKNITDEYMYDSHLLIAKSIAKKTIVENEYGFNYKNTWETPLYFIEESSHKRFNDTNFYNKINQAGLRQIISQKIQTKKPFSVPLLYNYKYIVLSFFPLADVNNDKNVAYIVTYSVSNYLSNLDLEQRYIKLLLFAILGLTYFFGIYILFNREKLKELALFDSLTKLPNRTLFMVELQNEINRAYRYKSKLAVFFIDLDGFKAVNDTYGHQVGDELLKVIAKTLSSSIRKNDLESRLSGDEFTVALSDIKNKEEAYKVAQNILDNVNKEIVIEHQVISIGASIGIALYPDDATNLEDLMKYADKAMYNVKKSGKNQIKFYKKESKNV